MPRSNWKLHPKYDNILVSDEVYDGINDCARKINGNPAHIHDCVTGKRHTHRGYHFEYVDEEVE